jgi:hypothetical protein
MHWFELVVTLRRVLLALLVGLLPDSNLARGGLTELVLVGALTLQHWLAPYKSARDNRLEELALGTTAFTFGAQSVWRNFNQLASVTSEQLSVAGDDYSAILIVLDGYTCACVCVPSSECC